MMRSRLGAFGKGSKASMSPPPTAPADIGPAITPSEEQLILQQTMPLPAPEPSFVSRNASVLFIGGAVLVLGIIGMVLLVKV